MHRRKIFERLFDLNALFRELHNPKVRRGMEVFTHAHAVIDIYREPTVIVGEHHRVDDILLVNKGFVIGLNHEVGLAEPKTSYIWQTDSLILLDHFLQNRRAPCEIKALAGAEVIKFSRKHYSELISKYDFIPTLIELRSGRDFKSSNVYFTGINGDAKLRLEALRKAYPRIEDVVQKRDIASFIGVSPVHFSRLLKK